MLYLILKALLSGVIVVLVSEAAKRNPALGALVASLPIVSVLGMLWLWGETRDPERLAAHAEATFWLVLPSLPMFLLVPVLLRREVPFGVALAVGCILTVALYAIMTALGPRLGIRL